MPLAQPPRTLLLDLGIPRCRRLLLLLRLRLQLRLLCLLCLLALLALLLALLLLLAALQQRALHLLLHLQRLLLHRVWLAGLGANQEGRGRCRVAARALL